jgi:hypothetical protein
VAAERVAADLCAVARRAFHVDAAAHAQAAQRGEGQALLHDVEVGRVVALQARHGEADTVHRHAGADGQPGCKTRLKLQREAAQAGAVHHGA